MSVESNLNELQIDPAPALLQAPPEIQAIQGVQAPIVSASILPPQGAPYIAPPVAPVPIPGNSIARIVNAQVGGVHENPTGVAPVPAYNWRPAIGGVLYFVIKTHKSYYDQGCKRCFDKYNLDSEGRHALFTAL